MRPGALRLRLVLEEDIGTSVDAIGGRTKSWSTVLSVRARAAFKGGKEFERAKQTTADLDSLFVIRYNSALDTKAMHAMRLRSLDDGAIYRIDYADDPYHNQREIHIHASETQSA